MRQPQIRAIDLNLIPVFEAVVEERNMTRAAQRLSMTQSAVSHAIDRLRHVARADLFVRQARGVTPTAAGQRLYERLRGTMGLIQSALDESRGFDPMTARRAFSIAVALAPNPTFVGGLFDALERTAPGVQLKLQRAAAQADLPAMLRRGACDLILGQPRYSTREMHTELLWEDRPVVIARTGHPRIRRAPTQAQLLGERWVRLADPSSSEPLFDVARVIGPRATVVVDGRVPADLLLIVMASDLLAVCSETVARTLGSRVGVRSFPVPGRAAPAASMNMSWHVRDERDPGHRWLRTLIARIAAQSQRPLKSAAA